MARDLTELINASGMRERERERTEHIIATISRELRDNVMLKIIKMLYEVLS